MICIKNTDGKTLMIMYPIKTSSYQYLDSSHLHFSALVLVLSFRYHACYMYHHKPILPCIRTNLFMFCRLVQWLRLNPRKRFAFKTLMIKLCYLYIFDWLRVNPNIANILLPALLLRIRMMMNCC